MSPTEPDRTDRLGDMAMNLDDESLLSGYLDGELDPALPAGALAHFCLLLAMGSALITPDLHAVEDEEWTALLTRVVRAFAPSGTPPESGGPQ